MGDIINADRAYEIGLANYLNSDTLKGSLKVASGIIQNSMTSIKETKSMIRSISNLSVEEAINYCTKLNTISRSTEDFKQGLKKFLKK